MTPTLCFRAVDDQYVTLSAAWGTLSLVNAGLAQAKGRSGLNWWLLSLLLGPFATLLIVAWPAGGGPQEVPPGRMSRQQALTIGLVVLVLLILLGVGAAVVAGTP